MAGKIANSLKLTTSIRWTGTAVHRRGRGQHRRDRPSSPISCRRDRSPGTARSPWRASPSTSWPSAGAARSTIKQLRKITHIATIPRSSRSTFEDDQIKQRALSNLGPGLAVGLSLPDHGTLDPVMAYKAESGDQSADEYALRDRLSHQFERITIDGDTVAFFEGGKPLEACYAGDGCEILTSKKGNRMGVKFRFGVALASSHLFG
ncbi:ZinT family metal-binding protein [Mesorhizobium japonicum R7A]|uniref:ZinT/AdcA family metal-binding protein n=2 Tax=Mesorhizobium TaxID=68287 RepID=A0ABZ0VIA4_9HYPH|nr:ZinT/AdcA family metal-binding protein [Mesorhizobium huakuii]QJF04633.1 ZinT family metal-binding protein [Mesorhizobium japonicum R7A]QJF10702.1 ZinT family metal-binding protein [Mesorhizobium japonicum]QJI86575.1 ZinT family metal-binding protein [Mesorhizobium japonicum]WQB97116.1 ZinT/AdcA family metal-binding protein [Mesorhizobium huakuii]